MCVNAWGCMGQNYIKESVVFSNPLEYLPKKVGSLKGQGECDFQGFETN